MIKFALAALLVAYTQFQVPYTLEIVAATLFCFSLIYYYMIFGLVTGLSEAQLLVSKDDIQNSTISTLVHITGAVVMYMSGYELVTAFILPWIVLAAITLGFSILIYFEILEIHDKE